MFSHIFGKNTTHGWRFIRLIQRCTMTDLKSTSGLSSMATWKRRSRLTYRSWGTRTWTWWCTLTATMPETKQHFGQVLGSLSSQTHIWSSGCPRRNLWLRHPFWWIVCVDDTRNGSTPWDPIQVEDDGYTYRRTLINLLRQDVSHKQHPANGYNYEKKRVTQSSTMLWERSSRWVSCW